MQKLSIDEMGNVSQYLTGSQLGKVRQFYPEKDFRELSCRRMEQRDQDFLQLTGISVDQLIEKVKSHRNYIKRIIDYLFQEFQVEPEVYQYFYNLFEFHFDKAQIQMIILAFADVILHNNDETETITIKDIQKIAGNREKSWLLDTAISDRERNMGIKYYFPIDSDINLNGLLEMTKK